MQRPDEEKRRTILRVARDLFSKRPYHEVRLDDVAAAAKVGKGTLYVYFASKEDLYLDLVTDAFDVLLDDIRERIEANSDTHWKLLEDAVLLLARWMVKHPTMFDLIRSNIHPGQRDLLRQRRRRLGELFERVLKGAVAKGEIHDTQPELTAQFIPAMIRSGVVWGRRGLKADDLSAQVLAVLANGVRGQA
jgi:AcrR family transcriptional regulator